MICGVALFQMKWISAMTSNRSIFFSLKINLKQSIMKFVLQWTVTGSGLPDRKWSDMISIVDFTILWMIQWAWFELNYKELNERIPAAKVNLVNPKIDFFLCFNAKNLEVSRLIAQSSLSNKKIRTKAESQMLTTFDIRWMFFFGVSSTDTDCYLNVLPVENNPYRAGTVERINPFVDERVVQHWKFSQFSALESHYQQQEQWLYVFYLHKIWFLFR